MRYFQMKPGRPIYNMQEFLRVIAMRDETLPVLIPDGIFGTETEATVKIFQKNNGLPETGEVDNDTWDRIIEVYTKARVYAEPPPSTQMFPASDFIIQEGEDGAFMLPLQSMILAVTRRFSNIPDFELSGVHTGDAVATTRELQKYLDTECDGEIDIHCWHHISRLYENLIAKDVFQMNQPAPTPYASSRSSVEPETAEQFTITEDMVPSRSGLALTPRLDTYGMGNFSELEETPLPQRGMRETTLREIQPESTILRDMESNANMQNGSSGRQNSEIGNEELNNTDMQGNPIPRNPNPENVSAPWQGETGTQEATLQEAPVRTVDTLTQDQRENAGLQEPSVQSGNMAAAGQTAQQDILPPRTTDALPTQNGRAQVQPEQASQNIDRTSMRDGQNAERKTGNTKKEPLRWNFF